MLKKLNKEKTVIRYSRKGFTLIELLIVISIIGVLTTLVLVSFGPIQKQTRDSQRKSDIKEYSTSIESFANKNNGYYPSRPDATGSSLSSTVCADLDLTGCSEDPKNDDDATYTYLYQSDGSVSDGSASATKYALWAKLENSENYWVICSTGKVGTKAQSGFSVSGGTCPL